MQMEPEVLTSHLDFLDRKSNNFVLSLGNDEGPKRGIRGTRAVRGRGDRGFRGDTLFMKIWRGVEVIGDLEAKEDEVIEGSEGIEETGDLEEKEAGEIEDLEEIEGLEEIEDEETEGLEERAEDIEATEDLEEVNLHFNFKITIA